MINIECMTCSQFQVSVYLSKCTCTIKSLCLCNSYIFIFIYNIHIVDVKLPVLVHKQQARSALGIQLMSDSYLRPLGRSMTCQIIQLMAKRERERERVHGNSGNSHELQKQTNHRYSLPLWSLMVKYSESLSEYCTCSLITSCIQVKFDIFLHKCIPACL